MTILDFIQGEKFTKICDSVFAPNNKPDCNKLENTLKLCCIKERNLVYTHTMYAKQLFDTIGKLNSEFIVVSHNCDENVNFVPPENVIKWFTQNVEIEHPKVESIPIGLENNKWFPELKKKEKMLAKLKEPKQYKNLLYINHNITTFKGRRLPYTLLGGKTWVTAHDGENGKGFDRYLDGIYNHKYVLCPRGNGLDTHRLWECLYMGSVPVVLKDTNNWFYNDMPILYVNKWEEVTEELLEGMWPMFSYKSEGFPDEWKQKLNFEYWKNKIKNYAI